jgi:hypothetical protein
VEASIRPVDRQFLSRDQLSFQIRTDLCGDTRFRGIGRRDDIVMGIAPIQSDIVPKL